jgi:hypothetical protein
MRGTKTMPCPDEHEDEYRGRSNRPPSATDMHGIIPPDLSIKVDMALDRYLLGGLSSTDHRSNATDMHGILPQDLALKVDGVRRYFSKGAKRWR